MHVEPGKEKFHHTGNIMRFVVDDKKAFLLVILISSFFSFAFSYFSILKYLSLDSSGYDLGIHSQILWSTLHGQMFYSPLIGGNFLAEHFAPFEFVQLPVYLVYPSPISILIFQAIFVSYAVVPLYLLSKHVLETKVGKLSANLISLALAISFEMSPYVQSPVSFDFHNIAFLPFFFFLAIYSFFKRRSALHIISLAFIVSLHSNFVYIAGSILLYEFIYLQTKDGAGMSFWAPKNSSKPIIWQASILMVSASILYLYLIFSGMMKGYFSGLGSYSLLPTTGETGSPSTTIFGLLALVFENPMQLLTYLTSNYEYKLFFLLFIFVLLGATPFFAPLTLITGLPYLIYALPSTYTSYYQLGYQYTDMFVGPVYIAAIFGIPRFLKLMKFRKKINVDVHTTKKEPLILCFIIVMASFLSVPVGIFSPLHPPINPAGGNIVSISGLELNNGSFFLLNSQKYIPGDSYILTQNNLMPYFSNYVNTYSTPWSPGILGNISKFQYIIIQNSSIWANLSSTSPSLRDIVNSVLSNKTWGVYMSLPDSNITILKKGYSGKPLAVSDLARYGYDGNYPGNVLGTSLLIGSSIKNFKEIFIKIACFTASFAQLTVFSFWIHICRCPGSSLEV